MIQWLISKPLWMQYSITTGASWLTGFVVYYETYFLIMTLRGKL